MFHVTRQKQQLLIVEYGLLYDSAFVFLNMYVLNAEPANLGVVAHPFDPCTSEAEAGGSLISV